MSNRLFVAASAAAVFLLPIAGHAGAITVDGTVDSAYGTALALQNAPTDYGDTTSSTVSPAGDTNGSELDGAYGVIENDTLYLAITGNLQNNGNALNLFIDTGGPDGQNTLDNSSGYNGLANLNGITFDSGMTPSYDLIANASGSSFYVDLNKFNGSGTAATGTYLGETSTFGAGANGTLTGGTDALGILAALNDSNTAGVTGSSVGNPGAVTTGAEFAIPLSALGDPSGSIEIAALLGGSGNSGVSNQTLGGSGTGLNGYPNPNTVNFQNIAGNQFFTVTPAAVPEASSSVAFGLLMLTGLCGVAMTVRKRQTSR